MSSTPSSSPPTNCPKCRFPLAMPPSLSSLTSGWKYLALNTNLDRSQPRCKQCDMRKAQSAAESPLIMWPTSSRQMTDLRTQLSVSGIALDKTFSLLADASSGGEPKEDEATRLAREAHILQETIQTASGLMKIARQNIEMGVRTAWVPFWAIWGPLPSQEQQFHF